MRLVLFRSFISRVFQLILIVFLLLFYPQSTGTSIVSLLLEIYRSDFHDWIDYNGVTFSTELLQWGRTFSDFWGETVLHIYG